MHRLQNAKYLKPNPLSYVFITESFFGTMCDSYTPVMCIEGTLAFLFLHLKPHIFSKPIFSSNAPLSWPLLICASPP